MELQQFGADLIQHGLHVSGVRVHEQRHDVHKRRHRAPQLRGPRRRQAALALGVEDKTARIDARRPGGGAKRVSVGDGGSRRLCRRVGHQRPGRDRPRAGARSQADRAGRRGAGRYLPLPVGLGQEARGHRGRRPLVAGGRRFRVDHASAHRAIGQGLAVRPGCGQS
ncbi:hypothetical protein G6F68_012738 [Rhizopus microsporus]|nr:hypothetical protein G6F68_012738 [Rhizopus microsporus]